MTLKSFFPISVVSLTLLSLLACSNDQYSVLKEISTGSGEISQISTDLIPPEIKEIKLSEFISDFKVIPLETKAECMISNTQIVFSKDFFLVGTQNFPGPARLYRFDNSGHFLNEIGKSGKGPGEHIGYMADVIHCYEDNKTILVKWNGSSEKPQIFDYNGTFIQEINQPFKLVKYIDKWSDSIWFSTGAFAGKAKLPVDSFALIFYNNDGKILKQIPRREFPPKDLNGYTPTSWGPSLYKIKDQWRFYMGGNDSVFKIVDLKVIPVAVILPDKKTLQYNQSMSPADLPGKNSFKILSETKNNWFLEKTIINKAEVSEYSPGEWGGGFYTEDLLIIVDKKSKKAINAKLVDDVFHMLPGELLAGGLRWQNDRVFFALQAINLTKMIEGLNLENITNPDARKIIDKLHAIPEDSNPVIFSFSIKDRIILTDK